MAETTIFDKARGALNKFLKPEELIQLKEAAKKIKVELEAPPSAKEAKLKDGTIITYTGETLAVGSDVSTVTPEGVLPLADGEYELEDGTKCTVSGGKVSAIAPAQEMSEAQKAEMEKAKQAELEAETKVKERVTKIVETFESQIKANEEKIKELETKLSSLVKEKEEIDLKMAKVSAANKKQEELLDILLSAPVAQPTKARSVILSTANNTDRMIKMVQKATEQKTKTK